MSQDRIDEEPIKFEEQVRKLQWRKKLLKDHFKTWNKRAFKAHAKSFDQECITNRVRLQPYIKAVEELRKALEDNKLNTEDEPINYENILIKLFSSADITLSKR